MELLKNGLGKPAVQRIASALAPQLPNFNQELFVTQATSGLDGLELKQRVSHLITTLHDFLPENFVEAAKVLKQLPDSLDKGDPDDALRGFAAWPLIDYAAVYGLEHPKTALPLLKKLTAMFSAEFAIRPFLLTHPAYSESQLLKWTQDKNEHVRRLASEGSRPRLPWGMQLTPYIEDPRPNLPLLEALKNDSSLYVRRSVANHLNDIAKDHPALVIELCSRWYPDASPDLHWVIKHATRSLVKAGYPEVFPLLGYSDNIQLAAPSLELTNESLKLGESLEFKLELESTANSQQKMVVDFALHFVKANGERKPKVFKLKSISLESGASCRLLKSHPIKPITTRRYYNGTQLLEILVNGKSLITREFSLATE